MMRKKQISRMLIGAFVACMATACSNETEVLNGLPTDGNTLSVNLRTNDIGAATRAIATPAESEVTSLSAYLFDQDEAGSYALEKVYNNLTWNADDETHTVALTGIQERGPKKIYFVANGTTINALNGTPEGLTEEAFQALMMNSLEANPSTPLPMTAQAELTEWSEGVNNATIAEPAQLKRVSARIDLQVDEQAGLTFQPTGITLASAAQSYIFPNEAVCEGDKTVEISGTTLYPYESAAGTVKEVKVAGIVTVGSTEKEAVFTVPFVNDDYTDGIAIERNHRYTVHITRINGFYSAEATITVSDWSAADYSGNLQAGEELIMTATESVDGQLATDAAATAVYPDNNSKRATVALTAEDAKVYRIYVGSANIETATTYVLPEGWSMAPANTRTEYLWKEYWTLTIPANESQEAKSMTIKAANKLELAKDANTEKFVEITFTQEGKEETVDHSKNPLLKWAKTNLVYSSNSSTFSTNYSSRSSLYQWGRNKGWKDYKDAQGIQYAYGTNTYALWTNSSQSVPFSPSDATGNPSHVINWYTQSDAEGPLYIDYFLMNSELNKNSYPDDYWPIAARQNDNDWNTRASKCGYTILCPNDWRLPSLKEYQDIMPSNNISNSNSLKNGITEIKEIGNDMQCAFRWRIINESNAYILEVKALMIDNNTNINDISWDNENIVSRYFGATGLISSYIETYYVYRTYSYGTYYYQSTTEQGSLGYGWNYIGAQTIANPIPDGTMEADVNAYGKIYVYLHDIQDMWTLAGHYWTSDGNAMEFCYDTANNMGEGSYLRLTKQPKTSAFAIRCVTDNPDLQEK